MSHHALVMSYSRAENAQWVLVALARINRESHIFNLLDRNLNEFNDDDGDDYENAAGNNADHAAAEDCHGHEKLRTKTNISMRKKR